MLDWNFIVYLTVIFLGAVYLIEGVLEIIMYCGNLYAENNFTGSSSAWEANDFCQ